MSGSKGFTAYEFHNGLSSFRAGAVRGFCFGLGRGVLSVWQMLTAGSCGAFAVLMEIATPAVGLYLL